MFMYHLIEYGSVFPTTHVFLRTQVARSLVIIFRHFEKFIDWKIYVYIPFRHSIQAPVTKYQVEKFSYISLSDHLPLYCYVVVFHTTPSVFTELGGLGPPMAQQPPRRLPPAWENVRCTLKLLCTTL